MSSIRIFVICNHPGLRRSLSSIFSSEESFTIVGEGPCEQDSVRVAREIQPDVILCELYNGGETNIEIIRLIKEACPYTKVLVLVNSEVDGVVREAIAAGADGCLAKMMLPSYLVKAVEVTCRTGVLCLPGNLKGLINNRDEDCNSINTFESMAAEGIADCKRNGDNIVRLPLTSREVEIYRLIIQNYSNKEIGKKLFISQPTVKSHVSNILRKLGLSNRTEIVLYEVQNKFITGTGIKKETC